MTLRRTSLAAAALGAALAAFVVGACGGEGDEDRDTSDELPEPEPVAAPPTEEVEAPPSGPERPPGPAKRLYVKRFVAQVRVDPLREAHRTGYLRAGAIVMSKAGGPITPEPRCRGGWWELEQGGFLCDGRDVIAFEGRRPPERPPAQPDFDAPLPYRFARTRRDRTPMYRRLPTDEEAAEHEGYRIPGAEPPPGEEGETPSVGSEGSVAASEETTPPQDARPTVAREASGDDSAPSAAGDDELDAEEEMVTLDSLRGERGSVVARRLAKGFIVSLDRDFRIGARRYWRSLSNGYIPYFTQVEVSGSSFHGEVLATGDAPPPDPEAAAATASTEMRLPIGYVLSRKTSGYVRGRDGRPRRAREPGYHHVFRVTSRETHRDEEYVVTATDTLFRAREVTIIEAREPPEGVGEGEAWIDIDLGLQSLVAYEGTRPVYATLVSTGRVRDPDDPLRDMRTPTGLFRITSKHVSHTMDGDHAVDGPYSIEDVPYVMYFQLAFALHSAFWHDGFGRPRSHGCVNLAPEDARWLFNWARPELPTAWHGIYPDEEHPGTWIYIHGETPEG